MDGVSTTIIHGIFVFGELNVAPTIEKEHSRLRMVEMAKSFVTFSKKSRGRPKQYEMTMAKLDKSFSPKNSSSLNSFSMPLDRDSFIFNLCGNRFAATEDFQTHLFYFDE